MNTNRIIYWVSTTIIALVMVAGGVAAMFDPAEIVEELLFPPYFPFLLGIAKVLGAITLLVPKFPRLKEWAYAGITFDLIAAIVAHVGVGHPFTEALGAVIFLGINFVSYVYYHKGARA